MDFNFDQPIDRKGTNCIKYDFARELGKEDGLLPLWVADMDFQTAPEIIDRLKQVIEHGIFGYTDSKEDYFQAVAGWYKRHFSWEVERDWLVKTSGVVFALATAVRAFTQEGDGVLIQPPVYHPFRHVIVDNHRTPVYNPLRLTDGHYEIDFEDFEQKIVDHQVKLFLLCSPHNPVSRVWKEWELRKIGDICLKHGVTVVSDEIHSDFIWENNKHLVFASLSPAYAAQTVTCTAPTKTFNLAGLQVSNIFISDKKLRKAFCDEITAGGSSHLNTMGIAACQAAYEDGENWLAALKDYIWDNYLFLKEFLAQKIPSIRPVPPEGTYLVWLDFRDLGLTESEREDLLIHKAHLWLNSGRIFGKEGMGFERINIACPRKTLQQALEQLEKAIRCS